jgi:hypothetical protein
MNEAVNWLPAEGQPDTKTATVKLGSLEVKLSVSSSIDGEVFYGYHGRPELPIMAGQKHMGSVVKLTPVAHITARFTVRKVNYRLCFNMIQGKPQHLAGNRQLLRVGSDGFVIRRDLDIPKGGREAAKLIEAAVPTLIKPLWAELRRTAIQDRRVRSEKHIQELLEAVKQLRIYSGSLDKDVSKEPK